MSESTRRQSSWKLLDLLKEATGFLASRQLENPRLEAELLLAAALGVCRLDLYLQFDKVLTEAAVATFRAFVRERLAGRPSQYITRSAAFRLLDLEVDERVLVPRPETEILVDEALAFLRGMPSPRVLDIGCGSGAIAVSIARELETARLLATDVSPAALAVARRNAMRHDVADRIHFVCADLCRGLTPRPWFTAIVANLPYVATAEIDTLQPEVRDHEPHLALDGGPDGLVVMLRLAASARTHLAPGGKLFLEVGAGQAGAVAAHLAAEGFSSPADVRPDLSGIARVVSATTPD